MGASEADIPLESISGVRSPTLKANPATIMHTAAAMSTHTHARAIDELETRASTCRTVNARRPHQYRSVRRLAHGRPNPLGNDARDERGRDARGKPHGHDEGDEVDGLEQARSPHHREKHRRHRNLHATSQAPSRRGEPPAPARRTSSIRGAWPILRAPSYALSANTDGKAAGRPYGGFGRKGHHGPPGHVEYKRGDSAQRRVTGRRPARAQRQREHAHASGLRSPRTPDTAPRPIPTSSYNANSRLRRRSRNRFA